jgi:hypothetical protein
LMPIITRRSRIRLPVNVSRGMAKSRVESTLFCAAEKTYLHISALRCVFFDRKIVWGKALIAMFSPHSR